MHKLMIVEDDQAFANALMRRFSQQGFLCRQVNVWCEALLSCQQFKPSHILLDMKLAEQNGLQLIKPLRAANPDARIVLLTGFASIATAVEAIRLGADDYLAKPADTQTILKALTGVIVNVDIDEEVMSAERLEWEHIQQTLTANEGNVSATARQLGMHRRTLQRKLQKKPVAR